LSGGFFALIAGMGLQTAFMRRTEPIMNLICGLALAQRWRRLFRLAVARRLANMARLVHFGAVIGSYLSELFGSRRITADVFIGCGVAAAIAAGFHAPIAGVVFAHEAVLRHFSFRAITPIAIASITSAWFSSAMFGGQPIFQIDVVLPDLLPLVPTLLASGLFFGLIAILFMKLLFASGKLAASTGLSPLPLGLLAAVYVALLPCLFRGFGLGVGTVNVILENGYLIGFLLVLLVLK
jgi:CIC family chloride channel protein